MSKLPQPTTKTETLQQYEWRLKQEAKLLAKNHVDVKPVKYLLKN